MCVITNFKAVNLMTRIKYILFIIFTVFFTILTLSFVHEVPNPYHTNYVAIRTLPLELDISSPTAKSVALQIFFATKQNKKFEERYSFLSNQKISKEFTHCKFIIPLPGTLKNIRFDLGKTEDKYVLKNLKIGGKSFEVSRDIFLSDELKIIDQDADYTTFESTGSDPYFEILHDFSNEKLAYTELYDSVFQRWFVLLSGNKEKLLFNSINIFFLVCLVIYRRKVSFFLIGIILPVLLAYHKILINDGLELFRGDFLNTTYKIIYNEYPVALLIAVFATVSLLTKRWYLKIIPFVCGLTLILAVTGDIFTYRQFNTHLIFSDLLNFYKDGADSLHIIKDFLTHNGYVITALVLSCTFFCLASIRTLNKNEKTTALITTGILGLIAALMPVPQSTLWDNVFDNILKVGHTSVNVSKSYSSTYKYLDYEPRIMTVPGLNLKKNVIIVMTESLSSDESRLLNGSFNNLENLDRLALDNIYFSDYYSEGYNTDAGNFTLLTSIPFAHNTNIFKDLFYSNSLNSHFVANGYTTNLFYTAEPIGNLNKIYDKSKFIKQYSGHESFYENSERLTFNSVPDADLFNFVVKKVKNNDEGRPFLSLIMTTTTHHPYTVPQTHVQNFHEAIRYVDRSIYKFYQDLKENHFFDNGILVITGDHRAMNPYTSAERKKFGEFGIARVPLIIVGLEQKYGIKDVPFSHSSLSGLLQYLNLPVAQIYEFNQLPIEKTGEPFRSKPILYQFHEPADKMIVLFKNKQYSIYLNGDDTYIDGQMDQKMQEAILKEVTWIRKP